MRPIIKRCAGMDVHQKLIAVCAFIEDASGQLSKHSKTFGTMTGELRDLRNWLMDLQVTAVAMESTGVLWKPVFNILEGSFEILLCNAKHIKNVPGRKTDVKDSEWIAQLLRHGLLTGSFVPARNQRDLRDLTRHRAQLNGEKTREVNRIHKILEDANIKLGSVASDIMGVSGRKMLVMLINAESDTEKIADQAYRRMRGKIPQLRQALEGRVTNHHRYMLKMHLEHVEYLERKIEDLTTHIAQLCEKGLLDEKSNPAQPEAPDLLEETPDKSAPLPFAQAVELLDEIPGIDIRCATDILAEIGTDMSRFATAKNLASWAALCPGNNESAGKHKSGKTRKANNWLRRTLTQAAWAASHTKDTYLNAHYHRLAKKRGKKRAIVAVSHSILIIAYQMLSHRRHFQELGSSFFDQLDPERVKRYHVKRLESLGFNVTLEKHSEAA